jgi:hypothetical protein
MQSQNNLKNKTEQKPKAGIASKYIHIHSEYTRGEERKKWSKRNS